MRVKVGRVRKSWHLFWPENVPGWVLKALNMFGGIFGGQPKGIMKFFKIVLNMFKAKSNMVKHIVIIL